MMSPGQHDGAFDDDDDDRPLRSDELIATGGSWGGLLFDNTHTEHELALTWTFEIEFEEIQRDYGTTAASLTIDWVRTAIRDWNCVAPLRVQCAEFAEPIESSVYVFSHHRYDRVELQLITQRGRLLDVKAKVAGDIDGLGLEEIEVVATLDFDGIYVHASAAGNDPTAAKKLLSAHTDVEALRPTAREHNVVFLPNED